MNQQGLYETLLHYLKIAIVWDMNGEANFLNLPMWVNNSADTFVHVMPRSRFRVSNPMEEAASSAGSIRRASNRLLHFDGENAYRCRRTPPHPHTNMSGTRESTISKCQVD